MAEYAFLLGSEPEGAGRSARGPCEHPAGVPAETAAGGRIY